MRGLVTSIVVLCAACSGGDGMTPDAFVTPTPDAKPPTCDTVLQDCATHGSAATPKCSLIALTNGDLVPRCVQLNGTLGAGASCVRFAGGPGFDDCDKGLFCSGLTEPQNPDGTVLERACRAFCRDDSTCASGDHCIAVGMNKPQDGVCVPTGCTLFSTTCGAGRTCDVLMRVDLTNSIGACRSTGTTAVGGSCAVSLCVADALCVSSTCRAACDDKHPCASGACTPIKGLEAGAGYCL